jgi:hypothetical protein
MMGLPNGMVGGGINRGMQRHDRKLTMQAWIVKF